VLFISFKRNVATRRENELKRTTAKSGCADGNLHRCKIDNEKIDRKKSPDRDLYKK